MAQDLDQHLDMEIFKADQHLDSLALTILFDFLIKNCFVLKANYLCRNYHDSIATKIFRSRGIHPNSPTSYNAQKPNNANALVRDESRQMI